MHAVRFRYIVQVRVSEWDWSAQLCGAPFSLANRSDAALQQVIRSKQKVHV